MDIYNEGEGFQEITNNPAFGDSAEIINAQRRAQMDGDMKLTMDELIHMRSQLEQQLEKASEPDRDTVQGKLTDVEEKITAFESKSTETAH